ncbi:MAG: hypothetical protein ACRC6I_10545 [Paracoccaceae bacterium]
MRVIDVQNICLRLSADQIKAKPSQAAIWVPFHARMRKTVILNMARLMAAFRARGLDVLFARITCPLETGRDRSLCQRKPGWNNLILPRMVKTSNAGKACAATGSDRGGQNHRFRAGRRQPVAALAVDPQQVVVGQIKAADRRL